MFKTTAFITVICFLIHNCVLGQSDNSITRKIDMYAYQLDTTSTHTDTITFMLDSVQVTAQIQKNRVVATCVFVKSKSLLTIRYYSEDKKLRLIHTSEQSPIMSDMYALIYFYYENGKVFDTKYRWTIRSCMAIPMDKSISELYGYNPTLNTDFFKAFVLQLYERINLQATVGFASWRLWNKTGL